MPAGAISVWPLILASAAVGAAAWAATGLVRRALIRWRVVDRPNERSSHSEAKPRGGGLALVPLILIAWIGAAAWLGAPAGLWAVLAGALLIAAVSWRDDLKDLPAGLRLLAQAGAVVLGLIGFGDVGAIFQGLLPSGLDWLAALLIWLWFINLFNFMDGIDGISGVEAAALGLGGGLVAWTAGLAAAWVAAPWLLAAAALGFLIWNWEPSRIFLGDVGSVPLGYLLAWLLLQLAAEGEWAAALILPAYYLADATITLLRRGLRGERVWQAHREHFYQRAVRGGRSHARVALYVALCNAALIGLALAAAQGYAWLALAGGAVVVTAFLTFLEHPGQILSS